MNDFPRFRMGTHCWKLLGAENQGPRDRAGLFDPQLVAQGKTPRHGFDDKILSLYARGMSTREIQGHLKDIY